MGLTSSLFTSLTGLNSNAQMLNVAGDNIANVNTTAFKKSRISFETQILRTLSSGLAPRAERGGTNPTQVGMGVQTSSIRRDFNSGSLQPTGVSTDMAINGNGFFVVDVAGVNRYTRDGNFSLDKDSSLISVSTGGIVQGFGVDSDFNIVTDMLQDVKIPIGIMTLAEATSEVKFAGNLNAGGDVATQGSIIDFEALYSDPAASISAVAGDSLASLMAAGSAPASVVALGDIITISGASKGGAVIPDSTFEVGPANTTGSDDFGTTVQDLMDFLDEILGIDNAVSGGLSIAGGVITIVGNTGQINDLVFGTSNFIINQSTGPTTGLALTKTQPANGESVRTIFEGFDSLGSPLTIDLRFVQETKDSSGTMWRFYAQSSDDTDLDRVLGNGTISFNTNGQYIGATGTSIMIDRVDTGSQTPQSINLAFTDQSGAISSLVDTASEASVISQDGAPLGTLTEFNLSEDGTITGIFSNNLLRAIGQIPVATFANNEGLQALGANLYVSGPNSGQPQIVTAASSSAGKVVGQTLELSNVDLATEFMSLITASTGFTANSRALSTSDRLIQDLLATLR